MSFFPAFVNLENKKVLVVGGGKIAGDKISHLLDFTTNITIIAPQIDNRVKKMIKENHLTYLQKKYQKKDIKNFFIVIVAADNEALQKEIFIESQKKKIFCNSVDNTKYCDFIFPSYIKEDSLVVAFSTSGISPSLSKYLRRAIQKLIPKDIKTFLRQLSAIRQTMKKGKKRQKILDSKTKKYIDKNFEKLNTDFG